MINGVINIYKEAGFTSHDVVAKMRGILKQKKIGHTGTLDPDATGVLPVCLGKGTKLCDMLTDTDKTYVAVMRLGIVTDTQDMSGEIIKSISEEEILENISEKDLRQTIESFVGEYNQIPPMYSALKVNGKKLYELARAGIEVERKARTVKILAIKILDIDMNKAKVKFEVECSKGTYIRTLCHDIGEKLGCGAAMESLERTKAAGLKLDSAITLSELERIVKEENVDRVLIRIDKMFEAYPAAFAKVGFEKLLYNGNSIPKEGINLGGNTDKNDLKKVGNIRMYDSEDNFIGIYSYDDKHSLFKLEKMFYDGICK